MPVVSLSPIALAVISAFLFGSSQVAAKVATRYVDSFTGARLSIGVTMLVYWGLAPFFLEWSYFASPWVFLYAAIGLFQPIISISLAFEATRRMGPTVAATLTSVGPLFTAAGAVLLVGETLTIPLLAGTLGVVLGVMTLFGFGRGRFNWPKSTLLFPFTTAAIRGFSHVAYKIGFGSLPYPVLAGLISYSVSFLAGTIFNALRPESLKLDLTWQGFRWLALVGVGNAIAWLCMTTAFRDGQLVVVIPIVGAFPLVTMLVSFLFFRGEVLNLRIVAGVVQIVLSVMVIALS